VTTSKDYKEVAEEAILDYFRNNDAKPFHSDDLWHVIPDQHRSVISLAVMALVNKKLITGCGHRKSSIPSRKGSPSQEYRLTELGRDRIVGVGTKNREGSATSSATLDRPASSSHCMGASPTGARSSLGVDPGEVSSVHGRQRAHDAGEPRPTAEPLTLLPEPDPEAWAA
jgi:hypothetical protein